MELDMLYDVFMTNNPESDDWSYRFPPDASCGDLALAKEIANDYATACTLDYVVIVVDDEVVHVIKCTPPSFADDDWERPKSYAVTMTNYSGPDPTIVAQQISSRELAGRVLKAATSRWYEHSNDAGFLEMASAIGISGDDAISEETDAVFVWWELPFYRVLDVRVERFNANGG
jgi:hypothetical protein